MRDLDPLFLEREVACDLLGLKRTKFFAACRDKELDRVKQGRKTLVTMESVRRYADKLMLQIAAPEVEPAPDDTVKQPQRKILRRQPTPARAMTKAAPSAPTGAADSPPSRQATQNTDFDDSWLTLAGVTHEQW